MNKFKRRRRYSLSTLNTKHNRNLKNVIIVVCYNTIFENTMGVELEKQKLLIYNDEVTYNV